MAEYIDKERLKQCFHANICGGSAYDELIDMQPTADVIERSEYEKLRLVNLDLAETNKGLLAEHEQLLKLRFGVDKAIDKIKGLSVRANKIQVLKILQECIGE